MRIKLFFLLIVLFVSVAAMAQSDKIVGKWHLPNDLDVEVFARNGKYFGRIIATNSYNDGHDDGKTTDINNSDKALRMKPLVGLVILHNLEYDTDEKIWTNGTMYNPGKGLTVDLEITKVEGNRLTAVGSKFVFWKTVEWTKIR